MIASTLALLAAGAYGITQLEIDFSLDKVFTIEEGSYQDKFLEAKKLFKTQEKAAILLGNIDFSSKMDKITSLVDDLDALESVDLSAQKSLLPNLSSPANLSDFLASPQGAPFARLFNISEETNQIQAAMIPFKYLTPHTTADGMALMDEMDALVQAQVPNSHLPLSHLQLSSEFSQGFDGRVFVWMLPFSGGGSAMYHMMKIMVNDMLISIGLTLLAIFIISLLMTVDLTISLLSLGAVVATIVDTAGFAHFWGLTIEPFLAVISSSSSGFQ